MDDYINLYLSARLSGLEGCSSGLVTASLRWACSKDPQGFALLVRL